MPARAASRVRRSLLRGPQPGQHPVLLAYAGGGSVAGQARHVLPVVESQFGQLPDVPQGMVWPELGLSPAAAD